MMEYLVNNFQSYAEAYIRVLIELYMLLNVALLIYWLRPFMCNKRSVYVSAGVYYALWLVCNYAGTSKELDRILTIGFLVLAILIAWRLDNRRNPVQKVFLFFVFRLRSWLSIELYTEIGFWERALVFKFDWYKHSIEATVIEFFVWNLVQYGLALILLYAVIRVLHKTYRYKRDELTWQSDGLI